MHACDKFQKDIKGFSFHFTEVFHKCVEYIGKFLIQMREIHTCHKLWTEICEIRQAFKGDLIKFCEIFAKITLELPQNSQKPLF